MTVTGDIASPAALYTAVQGFITGPLLTGAVALFTVSLTIRLAFKWVKKFAK